MPALDLTTLLDGSPVNGIQTNRGFVSVCAVTSATGDPTEYIVTTKDAIALNAVSANLQSSATFTCEKGQALYFGANLIVVSATTVISSVTPTAVPIYTAAAGIADETASHPTFGMASLPVADISGWNQAVNTVDAKTLGYGEQSQDERVSANWDLSLSLIIPPSNLAYYEHILPSADNHQGYTGRIYVFAAVPIDNAGKFEYGVGPGLVTVSGDPNPKNEIRRPQISVKMQYPYIKSTLYSLESVQRQALLVTAAKLAGKTVPS